MKFFDTDLEAFCCYLLINKWRHQKREKRNWSWGGQQTCKRLQMLSDRLDPRPSARFFFLNFLEQCLVLIGVNRVSNNLALMIREQKLLCLPIQIRFPIGGERVTCRWIKLINSLGRIEFTNSLGNNNLNFGLARDQVVHLWNGGKFV